MMELNIRKLLEINFHTYNEYMMISFPVYDTAIKDIGKEICMKIEELEKYKLISSLSYSDFRRNCRLSILC